MILSVKIIFQTVDEDQWWWYESAYYLHEQQYSKSTILDKRLKKSGRKWIWMCTTEFSALLEVYHNIESNIRYCWSKVQCFTSNSTQVTFVDSLVQLRQLLLSNEIGTDTCKIWHFIVSVFITLSRILTSTITNNLEGWFCILLIYCC